MRAARFVPSLDASSDRADAIVFTVGLGTVAVVDADGSEHGHDLTTAICLGTLDGRPCFAVAVDTDDHAGATPLMGLWGQTDETTWTIAGRAVQLVEWERTHRFCGRCRTPTEPAPGERARRCPACGLLAFPRLAPAIIVLVEREDGRALLARGRTFPIPMYSCLAGFVEPGETLEEAVHREVFEEVGIEIDEVRYWASQPWPFPHSLMLGFNARYAGGELALDENEIVDAQWYDRDELPPIPPGMSIARRLIDEWLSRRNG
ncbi:MAG TPA: NAD(+) diphosphatase [Acidimicrobiales bacterium]|jgi:NAD+ diphosphatase|nr:NAD(+) diphosphatase [Acidimicrobiales bacterium]